MAIGDYSYDDKGAVFLTRREPMGDYLSYVERYAVSFKQIGVRQLHLALICKCRWFLG